MDLQTSEKVIGSGFFGFFFLDEEEEEGIGLEFEEETNWKGGSSGCGSMDMRKWEEGELMMDEEESKPFGSRKEASRMWGTIIWEKKSAELEKDWVWRIEVVVEGFSLDEFDEEGIPEEEDWLDWEREWFDSSFLDVSGFLRWKKEIEKNCEMTFRDFWSKILPNNKTHIKELDSFILLLFWW